MQISSLSQDRLSMRETLPAYEICLRCGRLSPLKRTALDTEEDHVVMDVSCGTGILSIFCALVGARRLNVEPRSFIIF